MRLRSSIVAVLVVLVPVSPVLAHAQTQPTVNIPPTVLRARARENLGRASAFVAMAREAPAAATSPANAHRASALAHESATIYRSASAEFAKGAYQNVTSASLRSIRVAQAAIASASAAPAATPAASTAASATRATTIVENVSGGDVALGAPADGTPDNSPATVVRSRYHGAGPDAPPRPANWRVLGAVPFGAAPVQGVQPNGAAGLGGYATPAPFGIVTPVQQPPFPPAG